MNKYNHYEEQTKILEQLKKYGMTEDHINWLRDNATSTLISKITWYENFRIRFVYWFDVIKDCRTSYDVMTTISISNIDYRPFQLSKTHEYKEGSVGGAIRALHNSGSMTTKNINRLLELCRLYYNIKECRLKYENWSQMHWLTYIELNDSNNFNRVINDIIDANISIDKIIDDVDFMVEYIPYIKCDEHIKVELNHMLDIFNELIEEYELYNQRLRKEAKDKASHSNDRFIEYINSDTKLTSKKYWNRMFPGTDFEYDKNIVKEYFPDTYDMYINRINNVTRNIFTTRIHTLKNMYDKLFEKFGNLYNITLFDYVSNGGVANITDTINFIVNPYNDIKIPEIKKLVGPLKKLEKYTRSYISKEDEMNNLHIIKGHELTKEEKQKIFDYMHENNYPQWTVLFSQIAKAYIEGNVEL